VPVIEIHTALSRAECLARLETVAAADDWLDIDCPPDGDPVHVALDGHRVIVRNVADGAPPHTFRRIFRGEIADGSGGARVRGRFALHPAVRAGLGLWFGSMAAIVLLILAANLTGGLELPAVASGWLGATIPAAMLAAAALLVRSSLTQSRPREAAIAGFLAALLEGAQPPGPA